VDLVIVGGEDHKTGQADDGAERFARLERWARERIPQLKEIEFHWAGQVMESIDGLAFIGRNPVDQDNVFVITGDSGQGMTHGTIGGMLLTDLILGHNNPWAGLYEPSRKPVGAIGRFAKENLNVATQYAGWLTGGEISSPDELPRGHGAILRKGLTKVAVYRNEHGHVTQCSAVCPHLDCFVAWNATERTWDCPCHGSRFSPEGNVLNGPANMGLAKISE
jgi:nitrite reductase/ring-hydroxylating ferredoxin subunit